MSFTHERSTPVTAPGAQTHMPIQGRPSRESGQGDQEQNKNNSGRTRPFEEGSPKVKDEFVVLNICREEQQFHLGEAYGKARQEGPGLRKNCVSL